MAANDNQHFVPQFYFRLFNSRSEQICLLHKPSNKVIFNAPIKGQCAKHKFYGNEELERLFSQIESTHASVMHATLDAVWHPDSLCVTPWGMATLIQAIVFQRCRTALEAEKMSPALEESALYVFTEHLRHSKQHPEILEAIESGAVTIKASRQVTVLRLIHTAFESCSLVADLAICALRNFTDYPFIFGDSPVVFCNSHMAGVKRRGVLGLQCPGLQIFMPLNPFTLLMLYDRNVYKGPFCERQIFDVIHRADVSQLNALQLHHSLNAVYFSEPKCADYVTDLWQAHKSTVMRPRMSFNVLRNAIVDGHPTPDEVLHTFEEQINHTLSLSFVSCSTLGDNEYEFSYRSPELVAEHEKRTPTFQA